MAWNISRVRTKDDFKVKLSISRLKELFINSFPDGDIEDSDFNIIENGFSDLTISLLGWGEINGEKDGDYITIKNLHNLDGDFSGLFWDEIFIPIFEEVKLNAEMFIIWEEGEEIRLYKFKDGVVEDIEIDLFDFCKVDDKGE